MPDPSLEWLTSEGGNGPSHLENFPELTPEERQGQNCFKAALCLLWGE